MSAGHLPHIRGLKVRQTYEPYGNGRAFNRDADALVIRTRTRCNRELLEGSKVKVTCLETGKSTVVRINNRGPFHSNRLIDFIRLLAALISRFRFPIFVWIPRFSICRTAAPSWTVGTISSPCLA